MDFAPSTRITHNVTPKESLPAVQIIDAKLAAEFTLPELDKNSIDSLLVKQVTLEESGVVDNDSQVGLTAGEAHTKASDEIGDAQKSLRSQSDELQPDQEPSPQCQSPCQQPQQEPSPSRQQPKTGFEACTSLQKSSADASPLSPFKMPDSVMKTNFASSRFRKSCYFEATLRWGVKSFIPYNHMLLPTLYSSTAQEYENLRTAVCLWDVACERQIEVFGKDALQLAELLTPRSLSTMKVGECRYAIMTDDKGHVINDPVVLKIADDCFWFSISDSDVLFWIKGLALGRGLDVVVSEAAVSPLAVQGPKSTDLMRDLFGSWVDDLKFYHFRQTDLNGIPVLLARSGWSPERGYELYLQDESRGDELWELVMGAGQKYSISPGVPNHTRRLEGGLLVYGCDVTSSHSVLELGLPPKWVSGDKAAEFMGKTAIQNLKDSGGPQRRVVGLEFLVAGAGVGELDPLVRPWNVLLVVEERPSNTVVGYVSSACFSPALEAHIAIATVTLDVCNPGDEVYVETPNGCRHAVVRKLPFTPRAG